MAANNKQVMEELFAGFRGYAAAHGLTPMRELVYQYLRDAIIGRRLAAGSYLTEEEISQGLQVSRTPIREALRLLEADGLVKHHRRRGVEVRQLSPKEAADIYDTCMVLEGYAARLVAEDVSRDVLATLQSLLRQMREKGLAQDVAAEMQLHRQFHMTIYAACKNKRVADLLLLMLDYIQLFRGYSLQTQGRLQHSWEEHEQLVRAIELQDGDLAEALARAHLSQSKEVFLQQWQALA